MAHTRGQYRGPVHFHVGAEFYDAYETDLADVCRFVVMDESALGASGRPALAFKGGRVTATGPGWFARVAA
jgi:hypothetical protein